VKLTASRDSKEIAEHEIKLSATVPSEQFGTWGDSKQTIMDTELSWHKGLYAGPVSPPNVPGETGLTHVSFDRLGSIVTYYFRDDKLKAVSEMRIKTPPVAINDVMALYTTIYSKQAGRQTKFEIKTNDEFVGTEQERWDAYLSSDALYEAIRKGKLIYHRSGVSSVNGTIYWNLGYRNSQTLILEEIVLPPK
jgi:hypothetical protein